jgi:hypothetical protein
MRILKGFVTKVALVQVSSPALRLVNPQGPITVRLADLSSPIGVRCADYMAVPQ